MRERAKTQSEAIERFGLGDLRIEDATADLMVTIKPEHIACSKPGNPRECAIAQAFREAHGCTAVLINRTVAYADITNKKGERVLARFRVPKRTLEAVIRPVDEGQDLIGQQVYLVAPRPSDTLKQRDTYNSRRVRDYSSEYRARKVRPREQLVAGQVGFLRNGTGLSPVIDIR